MEISERALEQYRRDQEQNLRLQKVVKVLLESGTTLDAIREILSPFADIGRSYDFSGYERDLFNETRLYGALGKDDARSVLGIWRRLRDVCELLAHEEVKK